MARGRPKQQSLLNNVRLMDGGDDALLHTFETTLAAVMPHKKSKADLEREQVAALIKVLKNPKIWDGALKLLRCKVPRGKIALTFYDTHGIDVSTKKFMEVIVTLNGGQDPTKSSSVLLPLPKIDDDYDCDNRSSSYEDDDDDEDDLPPLSVCSASQESHDAPATAESEVASKLIENLPHEDAESNAAGSADARGRDAETVLNIVGESTPDVSAVAAEAVGKPVAADAQSDESSVATADSDDSDRVLSDEEMSAIFEAAALKVDTALTKNFKPYTRVSGELSVHETLLDGFGFKPATANRGNPSRVFWDGDIRQDLARALRSAT